MVWSGENLCPIGVVTWLGAGRAHPHQREWLGQGVAAVLAGDGSGFDGSRLVAQRGVTLPGATVAPGADGLKQDAG